MIFYYLFKPLVFLLKHTPRCFFYALARFVGFLIWHLSKSRRYVAVTNARLLGASKPKSVAKRSITYSVLAYLETFYAHRLNDNYVKKHILSDESERISTFMRDYPKAFYLSGHFGSWSMTTRIVYFAYGLKLATVGRATKSAWVNRYMHELRTFSGTKYLEDVGAVEKIQAYLSEGFHIGIYIDHIAADGYCKYVPFCGLKIPTIAGLPMLAIRKNLPCFFIFTLYEGKNFRIIPKGPIFPDETLPIKERLIKLLTDINSVYEEIARAYPDNWYLLHRRFKRIMQDDGSVVSLYDKNYTEKILSELSKED